MIIKDNRKIGEKRTPFTSIEAGDVFEWNYHICMKIKTQIQYGAIDIIIGELLQEDLTNEFVYLLNAQLTIDK